VYVPLFNAEACEGEVVKNNHLDDAHELAGAVTDHPALRLPSTVVGCWLLASGTFAPEPLRQQLVKQLNGGQPYGMNPDEPAVVTATCELTLKRLFPGGYKEQQITDLVAMMRERASSHGPPAQHEIEAVAKAALDGTQPPAAITPGRRLVIEGLLFVVGCRRLGLNPDEIAALVYRGERVAFAAGFAPPILTTPPPFLTDPPTE